jgi:hypothetical protein
MFAAFQSFIVTHAPQMSTQPTQPSTDIAATQQAISDPSFSQIAQPAA